VETAYLVLLVAAFLALVVVAGYAVAKLVAER
jgi:hypothetical protein